MVSTKHCCHGECRTDSRYREYWPKSLVELEESGKKVFIPFPKPSQDIEKCRRWIVACSREFFTEKNVSRNTYICALHWPGEKGPTDEHPDPLKANLTPAQLSQARAPKRKAPKSRSEPVTKKVSPVENDCGEESNDFRPIDDADQSLMEATFTNSSTSAEETDNRQSHVVPKEYKNPATGNMVVDQSSQTVFCKYTLSAKVDTMILRNEVAISKPQAPKVVSNLSYENIVKDSTLMKHFVGLTSAQFELLHNFLDSVSPLNSINFWNCKDSPDMEKAASGRNCDLSTKDQLFICLLRLRRGFGIKTLAALLSSPEKKDMGNTVSVECSRNFARQGNTFSSYKHTNTFKCLIAVTPNGGACFASDLFEGDIDDIQIFRDCGIMKYLEPYDVVLADRGFTVRELLNPLQVELRIPSFLKGRGSLSAAEELETRQIAKARIHVERFNERM
ncbi:unnamed protein product [Porites lobata]|uniref:THAP-type domain-containing protein n=1 Tax=Porites lobata TaxID=104759 RepID=A0ABN8R7Y2_9CNID|nr:unnamed protein product [Porites lobata]